MATATGSNPTHLNFIALLQQADRISDASLSQLVKSRLHQLQPLHDAIAKDFEHPTPDLHQRIQAIVQRGLFRPRAELSEDKKRVFSQIFDPIDRRYQVLLGLVPHPPPVLAAPSPYIDFEALQRLPGADGDLPKQLLDIVFRANASIVQAFQQEHYDEVRSKIAALFRDHIDPLCGSAAAAAAGPDALDSFLKPIRAAYDAMQRTSPGSVPDFTSFPEDADAAVMLAPVEYELPFKRLKSEAKQFTNETIRKRALTSIKAIKAEHLQIEKEAAGAIADARRINLVERIDGIAQRCLDFSELPRHAMRSQARLKICLDEALQPLEFIKRRLTGEERKQEAERQRFVFESGSRKSQLLRNEQEDYYRCSLFGEFLQEIGQEYGGENPNPTIFLAYANPTATQHEHESWIPKFVARLQKLLVKSKFTHVENMHVVAPGEDRKAHIEKAETSDVVILFGSRSLCEGEDSDISALMAHTEKNRTGQKFPILLHDALPAEFSGTSIDWREKGFVKQFLKLFVALWGCPKECVADLLTRWDQKVAPMLNPGWYADQRKVIDACPDRAALEKIPISRGDNSGSVPEVTEKPLDERLIDRLREHYLGHSTLSVLTFKTDGKWELQFPLDKLYCQLAMITEEERKDKDAPQAEDGRLPTYETILKTKKEVDPTEIFTCDQLKSAHRKRAVIYGAAGTGKTTFTTMLLHRWAKQELFQEFQAVFVIRLRNLSSKIYAKDAEWDAYMLLQKEHSALGLDFRALTEDPAFLQNSLLILDGWDELPEAAQEGGHLYASFTALQEMFPHTLITSRPGQVDCAKETEFEIMGFSSSQVKAYAQHYFDAIGMPEKTAQLTHFLDRTSLAQSLAHIPINLTILCALFQQYESTFVEGAELTISSLYDRILTQFYKASLQRGGMHQNEWRQRHSLATHPLIVPLVVCLERIAFKTMSQGSIYLERGVIERIVDDQRLDFTQLRNLGIFSVDHDHGSFIHLTFQEHFAAKHIARLYGAPATHAQALEIVRARKFEPRYILVFPMVAGILSLAENEEALQAFFDDLHDEPHDLARVYQLTLLARCFEECKEPEKITPYTAFIREVVEFIPRNLTNGNLEPLLRGNRRLMSHEVLSELFLKLLRSQKHDALNVLQEHSLLTKALSEKIIVELTKQPGQKEVIILGYCGRVTELRDTLRDDLTSADPGASILAATLLEAQGKPVDDAFSHLAIPTHLLDAVANAIDNGTMPRIGDDSLEGLIGTLSDDKASSGARGDAIRDVATMASEGARFDERSIRVLIDFLGNKEIQPLDRRIAADAIGNIASNGGELNSDAIKALVNFLRDDKVIDPVHSNAADALGQVVLQEGVLGSESMRALVECIQDVELGLARKFALRVIGKVSLKGIRHDNATIRAVVDFLRDDKMDGLARSEAAFALGSIMSMNVKLDSDVIQTLVEFAGDSKLNDVARSSAIYALSEFTSKIQFNKDVVKMVVAFCVDDKLGDVAKIQISGILEKISPENLLQIDDRELLIQVCQLTNRALIQDGSTFKLGGQLK